MILVDSVRYLGNNDLNAAYNVSLKTRKSISKISGNFQNILALKIFFEKKNSVSLVSATRTNRRLQICREENCSSLKCRKF